MLRLSQILPSLDELAPLRLAESWDNVGLLVGEQDAWVRKAMTCLTVTDTTLSEAIDRNANLIISHHPLPFKPLQRITDVTPTGRLLLKAIRHEVAIYSPHTSWDNAKTGINHQLAAFLDLRDLAPLVLSTDPEMARLGLGSGLFGWLESPIGIEQVMERMRLHIPHSEPRFTHDPLRQVSKLGIVCGSGGSFLSHAARNKCDAFLTGEATYHQCLEAEALGIALLMIGHHASEFFSLKQLAWHLHSRWPELDAWCSERERSRF
jgi:dinuclear metal center YbgI/SA1388 family protein